MTLQPDQCPAGAGAGSDAAHPPVRLHRPGNRRYFRTDGVPCPGAAALFGLLAARNAIFYDSDDESGFLEEDLEGSEFQLLLEEAYAMYYPGQQCMVRRNGSGKCYTSTGFSGYDMDVQIESAFDTLLVGGPAHVRFRR